MESPPSTLYLIHFFSCIIYAVFQFPFLGQSANLRVGVIFSTLSVTPCYILCNLLDYTRLKLYFNTADYRKETTKELRNVTAIPIRINCFESSAKPVRGRRVIQLFLAFLILLVATIRESTPSSGS